MARIIIDVDTKNDKETEEIAEQVFGLASMNGERITTTLILDYTNDFQFHFLCLYDDCLKESEICYHVLQETINKMITESQSKKFSNKNY